VTHAGTWHAPAPRVAAVDGTGAGDAFAAGLLVSRLGGADPAAALAAGCAAGAAAVTRVGAPRHPSMTGCSCASSSRWPAE
jgi:sugar/nucleoside kinase (ribokinase family)